MVSTFLRSREKLKLSLVVSRTDASGARCEALLVGVAGYIAQFICSYDRSFSPPCTRP